MCYTRYCRVLIFLNIKCTITVSRRIDRKIKWALILYLSHCEDKAISFCTFLPFGNRYKSRRCNDDTGGGNASQLGSSWEKLHKRHKWRKPFRKTELEFTKRSKFGIFERQSRSRVDWKHLKTFVYVYQCFERAEL